MQYPITKTTKYNFDGQSYASLYPNLHKYPATMIPQIGIELLKDLKIKGKKMLDPYCGSGSSFTVGLDQGFSEMYGFDLNPLAILIARAKFTKVDLKKTKQYQQRLRNAVYNFVKKEENLSLLKKPSFYNIQFWFSEQITQNLCILKHFLDKFTDKDTARLFLVAFSETVRECSYTRNNEFKLYKMKPEDVLNFNPDVLGVFFNKLSKAIEVYENYYFPKLAEKEIKIDFHKFQEKQNYYDLVLTSPPYGDSKTTVAYGQFSTLSNEWLGIAFARKIDSILMGGKTRKKIYEKGIIADYIQAISKKSHIRALQVSSFYEDLENSITQISHNIQRGGTAIYIVGNRRVKEIQLPTDQFIAEIFEKNNFQHLLTYQRKIKNKSMPSQNSPSNKKNNKLNTMNKEYIVVCKKNGVIN